MSTIRRPSERGQGLVEYALILILVAVAIIIILSLTGKQVAEKLCDVVIQLGGTAPDGIEACRAPRVTLVGGTISGGINYEAVVKNNHGLMTSGVTVQFYIDGSPRPLEQTYKYCAGGGDASCSDLTGIASGQHTLRAVATDTSTNLTGEASLSFTI